MWVKELECGELVGRHWRGNGKGKEDSVTVGRVDGGAKIIRGVGSLGT